MQTLWKVSDHDVRIESWNAEGMTDGGAKCVWGNLERSAVHDPPLHVCSCGRALLACRVFDVTYNSYCILAYLLLSTRLCAGSKIVV